MSPNRRQTHGVLWDVVAPWVRWPLHSPRRLLTVLAALVLAITLWHAVAEAASGPTSPTGPGGVQPTAAASSAADLPASPTAGSDAGPPPASTVPSDAPNAAPAETAGSAPGSPVSAVPPVPPGSGEAARGFVTAWAHPDLPAEEWLAGVRGYLTPELERAMSYTDPAAIPSKQVIGPAEMVQAQPDGAAASFDVPTDAGPVRVDLALLQGRWLVTDIVPASTPQPGD